MFWFAHNCNALVSKFGKVAAVANAPYKWLKMAVYTYMLDPRPKLVNPRLATKCHMDNTCLQYIIHPKSLQERVSGAGLSMGAMACEKQSDRVYTLARLPPTAVR